MKSHLNHRKITTVVMMPAAKARRIALQWTTNRRKRISLLPRPMTNLQLTVLDIQTGTKDMTIVSKVSSISLIYFKI